MTHRLPNQTRSLVLPRFLLPPQYRTETRRLFTNDHFSRIETNNNGLLSQYVHGGTLNRPARALWKAG